MTKLNIGLISLGVVATVFASGFGIYSSLNRGNDKFFPEVPTPSENDKEIVDIKKEEPLLEFQEREILEDQTIKEELEPLNEDIQLENKKSPQILEVEIEKPNLEKDQKELIKPEISIEKNELRPRYNNTGFNIFSTYLRLGTGNLLDDLPGETIGSRFSNYFINSPDDPVWSKKFESWKDTYNSKYHRGNLSNPFTPKYSSSLNKNSLINRCRSAYRKNSWRQGLIGRELIISQYWASVANYCTKENVERPENWYQY